MRRRKLSWKQKLVALICVYYGQSFIVAVFLNDVWTYIMYIVPISFIGFFISFIWKQIRVNRLDSKRLFFALSNVFPIPYSSLFSIPLINTEKWASQLITYCYHYFDPQVLVNKLVADQIYHSAFMFYDIYGFKITQYWDYIVSLIGKSPRVDYADNASLSLFASLFRGQGVVELPNHLKVWL